MGVREVSNPEEVGPTPSLGGVPANSFLVDKTAFLAFLVEILWAARQVEMSSDIKAIIAKEAGRFLGIEVSPEHLNISCARSSQGDRGKGPSQDVREGPPGK